MKVLLSGCSFSAACGWGDPDYRTDPRCWYNILARQHQLEIENVSYGGRSNREIIHNAKATVLTKSYDLVSVQLTTLNRVWYWREQDPLSSVKITGGKIWDTENELERQSLRTMSLAFNNSINEIERDLVDLILLQRYLNPTPLLLINFADFGPRVLKMIKDQPSSHTESNPSIIYQKYLATLASQLDLTTTVGFSNPMLDYATDVADDRLHPGVVSNAKFAEIVSQTMDKIL